MRDPDDKGLAQISSGNAVAFTNSWYHNAHRRSALHRRLFGLAQVQSGDESGETEYKCLEECSDDEDCFIECL